MPVLIEPTVQHRAPVRTRAHLRGAPGNSQVLHPFREGNGRAQRAFLAQLSADAGYALNWSGLDPQGNEDASVKSFLGDNNLLEQLLDELVTTG